MTYGGVYNAKWLRYIAQAALYGLFIAVLGYFSVSPAYVHLPPDQALIKLSFSHPGQPKGGCRERTDEELARLPPNMRIRVVCPRERSPVFIELEMDGRLLYRDTLIPSGLSRDGTSTVYRRFPVAAGRHHLRARLRDDVQVEGFNYVREADITLKPAQVFVVDFNAKSGGFIFK